MHKFDFFLELAVESIVKETSDVLCGDKHLETALKKSLAPQSHNNNNANASAAIHMSATGKCGQKAAARDNNND